MLIHSPNELAQFVSQCRKQKKINQTELGSLVGLKQTTVSKFEIRPETTQLDTLFRILSALNLEIHVQPKPGAQTKKNENKWTEEW